jgi:hypothetical protein
MRHPTFPLWARWSHAEELPDELSFIPFLNGTYIAALDEASRPESLFNNRPGAQVFSERLRDSVVT